MAYTVFKQKNAANCIVKQIPSRQYNEVFRYAEAIKNMLNIR